MKEEGERRGHRKRGRQQQTQKQVAPTFVEFAFVRLHLVALRSCAHARHNQAREGLAAMQPGRKRTAAGISEQLQTRRRDRQQEARTHAASSTRSGQTRRRKAIRQRKQMQVRGSSQAKAKRASGTHVISGRPGPSPPPQTRDRAGSARGHKTTRRSRVRHGACMQSAHGGVSTQTGAEAARNRGGEQEAPRTTAKPCQTTLLTRRNRQRGTSRRQKAFEAHRSGVLHRHRVHVLEDLEQRQPARVCEGGSSNESVCQGGTTQ